MPASEREKRRPAGAPENRKFVRPRVTDSDLIICAIGMFLYGTKAWGGLVKIRIRLACNRLTCSLCLNDTNQYVHSHQKAESPVHT